MGRVRRKGGGRIAAEDKFEKISKKIGLESLKKYSPYVRYSEHPYVEAKIKNTKINAPAMTAKIHLKSAGANPFL